jgi:nitrogenase molybdenum-iron protein NifN
MVSPEDLRHLREICEDFGLEPILLPDYSDTLDGPVWDDYHRIPEGGTKISDIRRMGSAAATIEFSVTARPGSTGGAVLSEKFGVPHHRLSLPIGVRATDALLDLLSEISGRPTPEKYRRRRGRLIDAYVDGHKYVSANRAVVYGEEELVVAVAGLLAEVGITPALCASGGKTGQLEQCLQVSAADRAEGMRVMDGADFVEIEQAAEEVGCDLLVGNSKGFKAAGRLDVPLVRVGFPVHDRFGGARLLHVGYRGTQALFDRIVNAEIERRQKASPVGYTYM